MVSGIVWLVAVTGVILIGAEAVLYVIAKLRREIVNPGGSALPNAPITADRFRIAAKPITDVEDAPVKVQRAITDTTAWIASLETYRDQLAAAPAPHTAEPELVPTTGFSNVLAHFPLATVGLALLLGAAVVGGITFNFSL